MALLYRHAVGVFLQRVLHVADLRLQALDALFQLKPSLLAALQLRHFLIQFVLHTIELEKRQGNGYVLYIDHMLNHMIPFDMWVHIYPASHSHF